MAVHPWVSGMQKIRQGMRRLKWREIFSPNALGRPTAGLDGEDLGLL
jgi:hypothetical protein